jgi:hypothetical protein
MIYGLNFNSTPIPEEMAKKFKKRKMFGNQTFTLQGVCESRQERDRMVLQASNGRRAIEVIEVQVKDHTLYGVYTY